MVQNAQGQTETYTTTSEHPFWVSNGPANGQWLKASLLQAGLHLTNALGETLEVISQTALEQTATVYNIEVHQHSTYHVGEMGVWVHNADCCKVGELNGGVVPSGFANLNEFANFAGNVHGGLKSAGYPDVEPILQGSAVTGKSFSTGAPFDVGRVSDFDVALASPTLLQRAQDLGIGVRSGGTRTGPLGRRDLEALGLTQLASELRVQTGRKVSFMIYQSPAAAMQRAPSISLPGRK